MAYICSDEFPKNFDVIVCGTGLTESLLAAAFSRNGLSVLHIDPNQFYGGEWASLMHREFFDFLKSHEICQPQLTLDSSGEYVHITDTLTSKLYENIQLDVGTADEDNESSDQLIQVPTDIPCGSNIDTEINMSANESESVSHNVTEGSTEVLVDEALSKEAETIVKAEETVVNTVQHSSIELPATVSNNCPAENKVEENDTTLKDIPPIYTNPDQTITSQDKDASINDANIDQQKDPEATKEEPLIPKSIPSSWNDIKKHHRIFVFDIWPKLIYAADNFIDILLRSSVTKYLEFKAVNKIMTVFNNELIDVPSSRADVFSTKTITMLEKRMLMKFVTLVMDLTSHGEVYEAYRDKPFKELMDHLGLNAKLQLLVQSSIAQVDATASTQLAIERSGFYLQSIGKYSNSPYLWPMYGVGEIPQGFCRLSAVFGGLYMLRKDINHITLVDSETSTFKNCSSIIDNEGKEIYCKTLVMCASRVSPTPVATRRYSRAVVIIYGNLKYVEKEDSKVDVGFTTLPSYSISPDQTQTIEVIQLAPGSNSCSEGTCIVHFTCLSVQLTAKEDLNSAVEYFFQKHENESSPLNILLSVFFNYTAHDAPSDCKSSFAPNVYLVSSPFMEPSYQRVLSEAETVFKSVCPGDEFLPTPPSPEDIIYETADNTQ